MNVTDVDDKIILRARRNHLLAEYRAAAADPAKVFSLFTSAILTSFWYERHSLLCMAADGQHRSRL